MIKIINGDLFTTDARFIAHQVNCAGVMGAGVALQVKERYPHVYKEYRKTASSEMLGKVQIIPMNPIYLGYSPGSIAIPNNGRWILNDEQWICNLFAQDSYGYGKQYTDMEALKKCFRIMWMTVHERNRNCNAKIAMPYKIGCYRGGANWDEVYTMMEEIFEDCNVELWRLDNE